MSFLTDLLHSHGSEVAAFGAGFLAHLVVDFFLVTFGVAFGLKLGHRCAHKSGTEANLKI